MSDRMLSYILGLTLVVLFVVACGAPAATPTAVSIATRTRTPTPTSISTSTPTLVPQIGVPVVGDVWQVTVTSVSRMKRLKCGFGTDRSTHWAKEDYELLEVTLEFVPIKKEKEEEMSVSTENVALIDSEGRIKKAVGGGDPSEPAVRGRRSDNCGLGGSGRKVVVESYLVRDTLITSFFFVVEEGKKGHKFQFMDYPPIALNE